MGKSTFYSVYKSKEACFVDVLENFLAESLKKADLLRQEKMTSEERTIRFFREIYLAKDGIGHYFSPTDVENLFRKLPPEYSEKKQLIDGGGISEYVMGELKYDELQAETLNLLLGCVDQVATTSLASDESKEEALNYLLSMLVDFFKRNKNDIK
jgi:AcrR family transcriptional regulator